MPLSKWKEIKTESVKPEVSKPRAASEDTESVVSHANENHHQLIAEAAYFRALARGFEGGNPNDDWYTSEAEIKQTYDR